MDRCEDWCFYLRGGGKFGDWKYFSLDFGLGFVEVKWFNDGYSGEEVVFDSCCFEEQVFGKKPKYIMRFEQ